MKQIIEKVMKNLCHDGTMSTSKTNCIPLSRPSDTLSLGEGIHSAKHDKNLFTYSLIHLFTSNNTPHPNPLPQGARGKWAAFTLAEVLITLGIIGVVAALTLPTLIQNYQKQVWVNQLKKAVSVWENGMKMMLADADTDDLRNTEFWQSFSAIDENYGCNYAEDYSVADNILKKYFKILKFGDLKLDGEEGCAVGALNDGTEYRALNGVSNGAVDTDARKIYIADGILYGLWAYYDDGDNIGSLAIDVNGENKGPNQWGRDTFMFKILLNGNLLPYNSYEALKYYSFLCGNLETGDISNAYGFGCAARIIADGWKMNY